MSLKHEFNYGWCYTDPKKGGKVFWPYIHRDYEYTYSKEFHENTKMLFESLALPMPKKDEVFHGSYNDLVFADSHGLVIRVGPARIASLINPLIIQPIGWASSKGITVSIYPGIEIAEQVYSWENYPRDSKLVYHSKLQEFTYKIGQSGSFIGDGYHYNMGVIRTHDENGVENKDTLIILDPDYQRLIQGIELNPKRKEINKLRSELVKKHDEELENNADVMAATIYDIYEGMHFLQDNIRAFEKHQYLRREFWNARKDGGNFSKEKLEALWDKCHELVDNPKCVSFPVWREKNGVYTCSNITVTNLVLHNNWRIKPESPKKTNILKH